MLADTPEVHKFIIMADTLYLISILLYKVFISYETTTLVLQIQFPFKEGQHSYV